MKESPPKGQYIGESAISWTLGEAIRPACSARVLRVYRRLKELQGLSRLEVLDVVPSYTTITVYFCPVRADIPRIKGCVEEVIGSESHCDVGDGPATLPDDTALTLPVRYEGDDLTRVAAHCGLTTEVVVALHTRSVYTVAVIGFLPHFPYLVGLDEKLATPRLDAPRTRVPAGSVAIGGSQTGVYPADSPGGWNIIGDTDPSLLETLSPGDRVVFREHP